MVLVFQLTGQGLAVAGLVAAEVITVLVLGPIAGVVIDRFSRKAVLIGADLFRATLVLTLLWPQGAWHAYVVAAQNRPAVANNELIVSCLGGRTRCAHRLAVGLRRTVVFDRQ